MTTKPLQYVKPSGPEHLRQRAVELHGHTKHGEAVVKLPGRGGNLYRLDPEHLRPVGDSATDPGPDPKADVEAGGPHG